LALLLHPANNFWRWRKGIHW